MKIKMNSIRTKIMAVMLVVLLLSLGTVTTLFSVMSIKSTEEALNEVMAETSKTASIAVENRLNSTKRALEEIGTVSKFTEEGISEQTKIAILKNKIEKYNLIDMDVADLSGKTLKGENIMDTEYFKSASEGTTYISSPVIDGGSQIIFVAAPVWKDGIYQSEISGVAYAKMNGMFLSDIVKRIQIGETGGAYIINENGTTIAHKDEQVVEAVGEITSASTEQAGAISQITAGLDQISNVVQSNSATAEESAAASEELSGQAMMLQEEVAKFTLKEGREFNQI